MTSEKKDVLVYEKDWLKIIKHKIDKKFLTMADSVRDLLKEATRKQN